MAFINEDGNVVINGFVLSHWTFHVSNVLFIISYINMDMIIIRLALLVAAVFMISFGAVLSYSFDTILWNCVFIVVHSSYLIPLLKSKFARVSPEYQEIYKRNFKSYMSTELFQKLMAKMKTIEIRNGDMLAEQGQKFSHLYYFYELPKDSTVYIIRNGKIVDQARKNYWLNAIEYYYYKKSNDRLSMITIQAKMPTNTVIIAYSITKENLDLLYDDYFVGKQFTYNLFEIWVKQNIVTLVDNERKVASIKLQTETKINTTLDHLVNTE